MATRSRNPLAGFRWLKQAINLGHRNPRAVFGGAAFMALASLLPSLLTLPIQLGVVSRDAAQDPRVFLAVMAFSMLAGLFLVPVFAGYMRLIDATERGQPIRARDVFAPYRQGETLRLAGFGVAMLGVYAVMLGLIVLTAGRGVADWYLQVLAAGPAGQAALPPLPAGFATAVALGAVLGLLVMAVYAIALGQVSLRRRSIGGAVADGFVGALRNLLPLLVFVLSLTLAWVLVLAVFALVVLLLTLVAKLVGMWLMFVLLVPAYIALLLAMFVVMFGAMYYLWRDVCEGDAAPGAAPALAA